MYKTIFPTSKGIVVYCKDKKVVSLVDCEGKKKLLSFEEKRNFFSLSLPFLRGFQYFFYGLICFFSALNFSTFLSQKGKSKRTKNKSFQNFVLSFLVLGSAFLSAILFGLLPGILGWLCVGGQGFFLLRNFTVLTFKLLFFLAILLALRFIPEVCELFRFNKAADQILIFGDSQKKKKQGGCNPINFLHFVVFVYILDFIVVTLIGANFGIFFNLLFHIAIFILCVSFGFEILKLLSKTKTTRVFACLSCFFVYAKPSITHYETVSVAINEINLLISQKGREFMTEDSRAFSIVYNEVKNKLESAGINDRSETDWLIATILGKNRAEIKLVSSVSDKQYEEIMKATQRRMKGESLDNIFGFTEFYGLRFDVNKKVLTPRMETEILVEEVLKAQKNINKAKILDIGTGSGAIAVSIAKNCDASVTAVDISKQALTVAENNAKKNNVEIEFVHSNLFDGLKRRKKFDIIVSNPPYIPSEEIKTLDKHVQECDPLLALDGGEDGLVFYREIISASTKRLNAGGCLFFEVGKGQAPQVRKLMRESGFVEIKTIKDYNKIERVVCGKFR